VQDKPCRVPRKQAGDPLVKTGSSASWTVAVDPASLQDKTCSLFDMHAQVVRPHVVRRRTRGRYVNHLHLMAVHTFLPLHCYHHTCAKLMCGSATRAISKVNAN
jgi:hypothetical protein